MPTHDNPIIHIVLNGKGGIGKSTLPTMLAQWKVELAPGCVTCIDTDPINGTFAAYTSLDVHRVEIMEDNNINPRRFDEIVELIMAHEHDAVIDAGATSFVALAHYMITNQIPALFHELERTLVVHVPVVGGPAFLDTLKGFHDLVRQFPDPCRIVVWLNPYFGPVRQDGKEFEDMNVYVDNRDRVAAIITLPTLQADTFGFDLRTLLEARRTFDEAINDTGTGVVPRQRLRIIRQKIFTQLDAAAAAGIL